MALLKDTGAFPHRPWGEAVNAWTKHAARWSAGEIDDAQMTVGLKGHVLNPAFPEGYSNWQKTDLHELIDAKLVKEPTDKNVVKAVKPLTRDAKPKAKTATKAA